jgi:aromatic-L-amino-acid decarboxylase
LSDPVNGDGDARPAATEARDRLELEPEEMRDLGHRVVDLIVEHFGTLRDQRVTGRGTRAELEARLRERMPEHGAPPGAVLDRVISDVLPFMMHVDHPRFFAFVPGPSNFVGAMADALVAGLNTFQGTWLASSGPSQVELVTVEWLREMCGMPESAGGLFVSGGSMANAMGLAVARARRLGEDASGATIYLSDQTHSAVTRGLRVLGFPAGMVRTLPSDDDYRMAPEALGAAVRRDRDAGLVPFCVVANAGTTNTGAVDPLDELADVCAEHDLWLHADGAYGAAAAISERGRSLLAGLGRVDSLALDPHKWLFQPFEIGCLLVREESWLREAFSVHPEYLQDTRLADDEPNFGERGIQLTRQFRALKLWMSLQVFGRASFAAAVDGGMTRAETAERELRRRAGWEIVTPARLGVVSFRWAPAGLDDARTDAANLALVERVFHDGTAMLSSTRLRGRTVLRLCTINPRTTDEDVAAVVALLDRLAKG